MIDPNVEELLESLYVFEIENSDYPSDDIVTKGVQKALVLGLTIPEGQRYKLTESGKETGENVIRRHRLAEKLLRDVLAVKHNHVEEDACRFEHVLQDGVDEQVCILLGHPTHCPHGKTIPQGPCCLRAKDDNINEVRPLCDAKHGADGTVAYLATHDNRKIQKLVAMGILPGVDIKIIRQFPSHIFQIGYSQFAVDRPLAEVIYVRWAQ
jgi:DtxR family transcriptional regulator, Mn-dependent transcriptional regulator